MRSSKPYFIFNMLVEDLVSKISGRPVHFFAYTVDGIMLMANDIQAEILNVSSADKIAGKCIFELMRGINVKTREMKVVMLHNINTISENIPKVFYEAVAGNECICIKSPLLDSDSRIIGVAGSAFFLHQIPFKDIVVLINELFYYDWCN